MTFFWIILIALLASAFFSGTEIAFVSSNKLKIELDRAKGSIPGQIISRFNDKSSYFIAMLLLGNNIALVIYGLYMEKWMIPELEARLPETLNTPFVLILIQTLIATLIILLFAEFLPKTLFRLHPNRNLTIASGLLLLLYIILLPIVFLVIKIAEFILRYVFKTSLHERKYVFSSADLEDYVKEFSDDEAISSTESDLKIFQNAIDFKWVKVRECMVPRTEISAIDIYSSIDELATLFSQSGHSKILLFDGQIDDIIGYVHAFDLFKSPSSIAQIKRNITFVPETMQANKLLERMIKEKQSMVIVLDEFGGTSGVVTLEDLMEEIFGEIEDEFDNDNLVEKHLKDGSYVFSARMEIDYINEHYQLDLPEVDEYETLGGFIIHNNEEIPTKGDEFVIEHFTFKVLKASQSRIDLVKMWVNKAEE
jgi:putative hemolysin